MLGAILWKETGRVEHKKEQICGLPMLCVRLPDNAPRRERMICKGAQILRKNRVTRVLTPSNFAWEPLMRYGLRPVETRALRCALAPMWVKARLEQRGIRPQEAVLRLRGEWSCSDLERVAWELCPVVRSLIVDAPDGPELTARLRREFGLPILLGSALTADLTLEFQDGPLLTGVQPSLVRCSLPPGLDRFALVAALWQCERVKIEEISLDF